MPGYNMPASPGSIPSRVAPAYQPISFGQAQFLRQNPGPNVALSALGGLGEEKPSFSQQIAQGLGEGFGAGVKSAISQKFEEYNKQKEAEKERESNRIRFRGYRPTLEKLGKTKQELDAVEASGADPLEYLKVAELEEKIEKRRQPNIGKDTAQMESVIQKQFTNRMKNIVGPEEEALKAPLEEYAQNKIQEYRQLGFTAPSALNQALKDTKERKDSVMQIVKIATSPNLFFSDTNKIKGMKDKINAIVAKGKVIPEEAKQILQQAGWDDEQVEIILSPELTPGIMDYFLDKYDNDSQKATQELIKLGFKVE